MKNDADMERGIITITENGAVTMPTAPVWMTQQEMCDAFNVFGCYIRKAIAVIYKNNELSAHPTNPVECCADANPKTMLPNDT